MCVEAVALSETVLHKAHRLNVEVIRSAKEKENLNHFGPVLSAPSLTEIKKLGITQNLGGQKAEKEKGIVEFSSLGIADESIEKPLSQQDFGDGFIVSGDTSHTGHAIRDEKSGSTCVDLGPTAVESAAESCDSTWDAAAIVNAAREKSILTV